MRPWGDDSPFLACIRTLRSSKRITAIRYMESSEGQLLLQGTELGFGWSGVLTLFHRDGACWRSSV
ncbi:hypothetical protein CA601_46665 [Paraburkholderia hospita]|nr:hypothetical protein CA601_46665 [Paraburkholderia hospita]